MNRFITALITNENGQDVNKTVMFKASDVVQIIDLTSSRQITLWDRVNQKEVVLLSSTTLAAIQEQSSAAVSTLVRFVCNATSPYYAGLTVLLNPERILNVSGTSTTSLDYLSNMSSNIVSQVITLTSSTAAATTIAGISSNFAGSPIKRAKVTIRSAELLGTEITTGITLLPALGAGFAYNVISVATKASGAGTTPYAVGASISIQCAGATQSQFFIPVQALTNASAATKIGRGTPATVSIANTVDQIVANTALVAIASTAFQVGDFDLDVFVTYEVLALSL